MVIETLSSNQENTNPFSLDQYHMGTIIGTNVTVMYAKFEKEKQDYIIVVNTETGQRIKITL